jgi:hypothetical protein
MYTNQTKLAKNGAMDLYEKCVVSLDQVLWPVNYASKTKLHKNV